MKKTHQRVTKGLAAGLLVACLAAMPTSAFAAEIGQGGTVTTHEVYVDIGKDIAIYNDGFNKSYSPNITYTFTIAPATVSGASVTDTNGTTMTVYSGVGDALNVGAAYDATSGKQTANVAFTSAEKSDTDENLAQLIRENMRFSFNTANFTSAGIFRYVITDETPAAVLLAAGIVRPSDYEATKYLDVYVEKVDPTDPTSGYQIGGYVLLDQNVTTITTGTEKDPGFRMDIETTEIPFPGEEFPGQPGTPEQSDYGTSNIDGDNSVDYYVTYNVEVDKTITGNMADTSHAFPFTIAINTPSGKTVGTAIYAGSTKATAATDGSLAPSLANGGKYYVCGINPLATVDVSETNNSSNTYIATPAYNGTDEAQVTMAPGTGSAALSTVTISNYPTSGSAAPATITGNGGVAAFTNDCSAGTPTGIALMVAPFIAVAAVIATIFGINKIKTKKETDAE